MQLFTLDSYRENQHVTLKSRGVAVTYDIQGRGNRTRLHVRVRFAGPAVIGWAMALGDVVMMRKQLLTLCELAERDAAAVKF